MILILEHLIYTLYLWPQQHLESPNNQVIIHEKRNKVDCECQSEYPVQEH